MAPVMVFLNNIEAVRNTDTLIQVRTEQGKLGTDSGGWGMVPTLTPI
jgi:hypothetical protein